MNPFVTGLLVGAGVAAAAATYLTTTRQGQHLREELADRVSHLGGHQTDLGRMVQDGASQISDAAHDAARAISRSGDKAADTADQLGRETDRAVRDAGRELDKAARTA